ncbi:xylose isomerase [Thalassobaculum fulvum]|uniref:Xylose isomerase n=1 Tax=Thalassobaculum fulvum TaxID=1633335 RepID=A0A918XUH9_9PROT|nr:sugar phosphate isomerase/epimerase [Thalassobaculum fulvum]GHD57090.1 xylose isomerase [Thalassobaculum fulvum]
MTAHVSIPPLGLAHFTALEVPPLELVGLAARTGFASIGLRLVAAAPGTPVYVLRAGSPEVAELRHRLHDNGVRVHDLEIVTIDEHFDPRALEPVLDAGSEIGASRLSVCADDPDRARLVDRFGALCDLAAHYAIGVDLEWMGWRAVRTLGDALDVVTRAGRPNAGMLVDALHLARNGGSPADVARVPPGLIRSVQLCDARAEAPVGTEAIIAEARGGRLPPGEGALPLAELVAALPADANLSFEVPMGTALPAEERLRRIHAAAVALLERHPKG